MAVRKPNPAAPDRIERGSPTPDNPFSRPKPADKPDVEITTTTTIRRNPRR